MVGVGASARCTSGCRCYSGAAPGSARPPKAIAFEKGRRREFDPARVELRALRKVVSFERARILEIGVGDGRLSFQFASEAARVVGIDLSRSVVHEARRATPAGLHDRVDFHCADAEHLPYRCGTFDIALLGWSL